MKPYPSNGGRIQTRNMLIGHSRTSPYVASNAWIALRVRTRVLSRS